MGVLLEMNLNTEAELSEMRGILKNPLRNKGNRTIILDKWRCHINGLYPWMKKEELE